MLVEGKRLPRIVPLARGAIKFLAKLPGRMRRARVGVDIKVKRIAGLGCADEIQFDSRPHANDQCLAHGLSRRLRSNRGDVTGARMQIEPLLLSRESGSAPAKLLRATHRNCSNN